MPAFSGNGMVKGCFAALQPGQIAFIRTINSALYPRLLQQTVCLSVDKLKLKHNQVKQQDENPKHKNKFTPGCLKRN